MCVFTEKSYVFMRLRGETRHYMAGGCDRGSVNFELLAGTQIVVFDHAQSSNCCIPSRFCLVISLMHKTLYPAATLENITSTSARERSLRSRRLSWPLHRSRFGRG